MKSQHQVTDVREWRRLRAWELHEQGWWQKDIAAAMGVSTGAVSQWLKRGRGGGVAALKSQPRRGAVPKLAVEQRAQVPSLLARGAEAFGFRGDVWTCQRIAALIAQTFGVRYHPEHVQRLLQQAGWSVQQPVERAAQRDEAAIQQWWEERWPAIKEKASDEGFTIVWVDESGFYLLPLAVRTWAPRGQTPIVRVKLTHDHLAAISGITLDGRLFLQVGEEAYTAEVVVGFLRAVLRKLRGKIW